MTAQLSGRKILVIDDSKASREATVALLQQEGCIVISASDGFESLAKIVQMQPDVILLDSIMPKLDGYQTCMLIKNNPAFKHIPVVIMASDDTLLDQAKARFVNADHFLIKPFTKEELLALLTA